MHLDHVPRGAGRGRDDRRVAPGQAVQEARLARIRSAEDGDGEAVAQALPLVAVVQVTADVGGDGLDVGQDRRGHGPRQILVGKLQVRLQMGQRPHQPRPPLLVQAPQGAIHLAQGLAPLGVRLGADQVGHALGGGEVELAVLEGAPCELPGLGQAQAIHLSQRRDYAVDHRPTAMDVQLGHVLAGVAGRLGKPQGEPVVQGLARAGLCQAHASRAPGRRHRAPGQGLEGRAGAGA